MLHALSEPPGLAIVRHLASRSECACGHFDSRLSKGTLSHHYRVLRECGMIKSRPDGRKRLLSLRHDDLNARFPGLLDAVLSQTRPAGKLGAGR